MKDLRIRAQNFLSHEDTEIRLDGIDAVTVVGKNGSGKSSLIVDAPLLAVFGKARGDSIDDYIRNGKEQMIVEYDFSILDDRRYRVIRKRSRKTARGSSALEFKRIDAGGEEIEDLTQGSIDETQMLIDKTIATDFETLMHTSIYEQEEADFFCRARPSERMKLFSKIWDLEKYASYAQAARDVWLGKKDKPGLQAQMAGLESKIEAAHLRISEIKKQGEGLQALRKELQKEISTLMDLEKERGELQKKLGQIENVLKDLQKAKDQKGQVEKEIKTLSDQHGAVLSKIERFQKILNNQETVKAKVTEEKEKSVALAKIETEIEGIENQIEAKRDEIEAIRKEYETKLTKIETETQAIEAEIAGERKKETALQKSQAQIGRKEEQLKHLCLDADKLQGIACHPEVDVDYINEGCRFIKDAAAAKRLIPELEAEIATEQDQVESEMARIKAGLAVFEEKKSVCLSQVSETKKDLSQAIQAIDAEINKGLFSRKDKVTEKEQAKDDLIQIRKYTVLLPEIDLAEKELPELKKEATDLEKRSTDRTSERDRHGKEIERLSRMAEEKTEIDKSLVNVSREISDASGRKDGLTKKIGFAETEIAQGEVLKSQIIEDENEIERLNGEKALYQILEDAFKQIPYMLVARGVDSVQRIANEILGMVSQAGLTVEIKTEKETKTTKSMKDEIYLSFRDNEGHKEYKLLSQGEKVRAAVALRLAMSEAQAHRRGVRIDKLIADDVFGALDTEGIEDMKEAMRELKKRFKFMAILTHIETAQNIFPTRLLFVKGPQGSRVEIQEEYA